ncbi:hypothetical protein [Lentzea sp. NPDC051838]|uniref:hypothetical protein n=1 Tax=Lentzea sp. NPDC051838 TaxID=3154849 RepID=UPI0034440E39
MTRIHHFDDGVTPPLDFDAIDRRRAERSPAETAARQALRDAGQLGRDAFALGELQLAAGNLERARDAFAIAARYQALDAADLLHTVTELLDVLDSPVISGVAANTAMARTPDDPDNEPEIVTLRAQELVHRLDGLQARIKRLTADANSSQAAISDARTQVTAILEDAQTRAAAILKAAQHVADSTAQDTVTRADDALGVSDHGGQGRLLTPADFEPEIINAWLVDRDSDAVTARPTDHDVAQYLTKTVFLVFAKSSASYTRLAQALNLKHPQHLLPRTELPVAASPLTHSRVMVRVVGVGGCGASPLWTTRFSDLVWRADQGRSLGDRWHDLAWATQLGKSTLTGEVLDQLDQAGWDGLAGERARAAASALRNQYEETYARLHELLTVITEGEPG